MREYFLTDNQERFEEETLNYASIAAVKIGLDWISELGMEDIKARLSKRAAGTATEQWQGAHSHLRALQL